MVVGVDIGGSGVRAAQVRDGVVGPVCTQDLRSRDVSAILKAVSEAVRGCGGGDRVGVGVPGFVDRGIVRASPNFPALSDTDLAGLLVETLGVPVVVDNDANCAALGCWHLRGAREELVVLTLGTGVGGGVISNGQLLRGARGTGAELGHVFVGGDRPCGCGGVGCVEQYLGTVGLMASAAALGRTVEDGETVVRAAEEGEEWALTVMDQAADALGRALTIYVNLFAPDAVVLTGGLAAARPLLEPRALAWLRDHGIAASVDNTRLEWMGRADDLSIRGAAMLRY